MACIHVTKSIVNWVPSLCQSREILFGLIFYVYLKKWKEDDYKFIGLIPAFFCIQQCFINQDYSVLSPLKYFGGDFSSKSEGCALELINLNLERGFFRSEHGRQCLPVHGLRLVAFRRFGLHHGPPKVARLGESFIQINIKIEYI